MDRPVPERGLGGRRSSLDHMSEGELFGHLPDGTPVRRFTVSDGRLQLRVLTLGAIVQELWVPDGDGGLENVVLGFADVRGYVESSSQYYGAVVGRYANRIGYGELVLGGRAYALAANDGPHTLHGGREGFHQRVWTVASVEPQRLVLALVSPAGDGGFPGELTAEVSYEVDDGQVSIAYRAQCDALTVVNLSQHAYFNLAGEGSGSVHDHQLRVNASRYTPVDDALLPTGEIATVDGTPLDLRAPQRIGDIVKSDFPCIRRTGGLDHNFVLDTPSSDVAASLSEPRNRRELTVLTDQPGLQVYTANHFDGTHVGVSGRAYRRHHGIALETQRFPDAPRHQGEHGWPDATLSPGEVYQAATKWRFAQR